MAQDIDAVRLQLAFSRLSKYVSEIFPDVLPLELYTIGGAVIVTVIGSRMTTQDVDISIVKLHKKYGDRYPSIQAQFKSIILSVYEDLLIEGIDIGGAWMNWAVDLVLPDGTI